MNSGSQRKSKGKEKYSLTQQKQNNLVKNNLRQFSKDEIQIDQTDTGKDVQDHWSSWKSKYNLREVSPQPSQDIYHSKQQILERKCQFFISLKTVEQEGILLTCFHEASITFTTKTEKDNTKNYRLVSLMHFDAKFLNKILVHHT